MKSRGVKKILQDSQGNYVALCNDGSIWIAREISWTTGKAKWIKVSPVPSKSH